MTELELEKIIDKYSRLMWTVASRILNDLGNEQDVEECIADVFIDLWKDPDSFDSDRGSIRTWLCLKVRSKAIDRFRKLSLRLADELDPEQASQIPEPAEELIRRERTDELRTLIARLDDESREIVTRRFFMDQKPAQISRIMDLPVRRVENVIYRSKEKLKNGLGGYYE